MLTHYHVKLIRSLCAASLLLTFVHGKGPLDNEDQWIQTTEGDSTIMQCTLQDNVWKPFNDAKSGICSAIGNAEDENGAQVFIDIILGANPSEAIGNFITNKIGNSFDLGGFARCKVDGFTPIEHTSLGKLCDDFANIQQVLSPIIILGVDTIDADGIIGAGVNGKKETKLVEERKYPGMDGNKLFKEDGGFLIKKMAEEPYGSTATAYRSFDKATIVLKTMAAKTKGTDVVSDILLPKTKANSMDLEDETVELSTRMTPDFSAFSETLTRRIMSVTVQEDKVLKKAIELGYGNNKDELSLTEYRTIEQSISADYYKDEKAGLIDVYKAVENEAKARLASEQLLMTADPNYIADPSEARMAFIKDSQKNAFRYASLIQQEKNKRMKFKIAMDVKRKRQLIDIIKRQSEISASRFRDDIAENEIKVLLEKVDESVKVEYPQ